MDSTDNDVRETQPDVQTPQTAPLKEPKASTRLDPFKVYPVIQTPNKDKEDSKEDANEDSEEELFMDALAKAYLAKAYQEPPLLFTGTGLRKRSSFTVGNQERCERYSPL